MQSFALPPRLSVVASLCLSLGFGQVLAQDVKPEASKEEMQVVAVNGMKKPDMRDYRKVWVGLDTFDDNRSMAPGADLHFRIVPKRSKKKTATLDGVTLKIIGDGDPLPIPIAADGLLTIPRSQEAYDSKAILLLNQKQGIFETMPDIRTPGLPVNVRRLGDLRLECKVLVAIVKEEIGFFEKAMINTLLLTTDWCTFKEMRLPIRTDKQVASATLVHGERRAEVEMESSVGEPIAPLGDKSWPDNTLIELKFVE